MTLYAILGSVVSVIAAIVGAFVWGGKSANRKSEARQAEAKLDAYIKSRKSQDEVARMSDADILDRLRDRSGE